MTQTPELARGGGAAAGGGEREASLPPDRRVFSLDAVRGLAILMMCLSGVVPRYLPNWMYHGYYPQYLPDDAGSWARVDNPWAFWSGSAFTWVDWVFPMFLFAMGAAFPFAMRRRLERGAGRGSLAVRAVGRGVILIGFAVYVQQITPRFIAGGESPGWGDHLIALLGFAVLFPVLLRWPRAWPRGRVRLVKGLGLAAAVGLLAWIHLRADLAFSWNHKDIIILLLAWMAIAGSLLWLITPGRLWPLRLAVGLGVAFVAHHQGMKGEWRLFGDAFEPWMAYLNGWPRAALDLTWLVDHPIAQLQHLCDFTWFKFLWIVIPGTIVGDRLLAFMDADGPSDNAKGAEGGHRSQAWRPGVMAAVALLHLAAIGVVLWAFSVRMDVRYALFGGGEITTAWLQALAAAALVLTAVALSLGAGSPRGRLVRDLTIWAAVWLALGLAVEPWEGGIKKGPPSTLSWYLLSTALSVSLLAAFVVVIDAWRVGRFMLGWLVLNGQNPMVAYVGIRNLLAPVVSLPLLAPVNDAGDAIQHDSLDGVMTHDVLGETDAEGRAIPWLVFLWSLGKTLGLAAAVSVFTRLKLVLRS